MSSIPRIKPSTLSNVLTNACNIQPFKRPYIKLLGLAQEFDFLFLVMIAGLSHLYFFIGLFLTTCSFSTLCDEYIVLISLDLTLVSLLTTQPGPSSIIFLFRSISVKVLGRRGLTKILPPISRVRLTEIPGLSSARFRKSL
jgi:hypothetical protein